MKIRLTCALTLWIAVLAALSVDAVAAKAARSDRRYNVPTTSHYGPSASATKVLDALGETRHSRPTGSDEGPQLKQAADFAMHASIAPPSAVVLSVIAILRLPRTETDSHEVDLPARRTLFKVLFRVIIAPNAP